MARAARRYLVEEPEREHQGVRTLVGLPFMIEKLLTPLGLNASFSWFILRVNKRRLRPSANGDVDLLAGPLEWNDPREYLARWEQEKRSKRDWHPTWPAFLAALKLANDGGIRWPPPMNHLVALEAKCAYLHPQAEEISRGGLKSTKTSRQNVRRTQRQIQGLVEMGFDRIALLDIIANPPVSGLDGQAWIVALDVADLSMKAMLPDLRRRLPVDCPAGHFVWSAGAIVGGDESRRGAGSPIELRPAIQNPLLQGNEEVKAHRFETDANLRREFGKIPAPLNLRVIFADCEKCGQLHSGVDACEVQTKPNSRFPANGQTSRNAAA
jgi:hypothetical protein